MRRVDSLEKTLLLGGIGGRRKRGRERMRWLDGITDSMDESEWTLGVSDRQGGLACWDSWGHKESDMTERLNWTDLVSNLVMTKNAPVNISVCHHFVFLIVMIPQNVIVRWKDRCVYDFARRWWIFLHKICHKYLLFYWDVPFTPTFIRVFLVNGCCVLSMLFPVSTGMIVWSLSLVDALIHIDWSVHVEPFLWAWDDLDLMYVW